MATVFETRLIGNLGKDATLREMENGVLAIQFPIAHNKKWKDRRTGEINTKTTWVYCTIWRKPNMNTDLVKLLSKGTLVEVQGFPIARTSVKATGETQAEIRITVEKINILKGTTIKNDVVEIVENEIDDNEFFADLGLE